MYCLRWRNTRNKCRISGNEGAVRTGGNVVSEQATLSIQHQKRRWDHHRQQIESLRVNVFDYIFHSFLKKAEERIEQYWRNPITHRTLISNTYCLRQSMNRDDSVVDWKINRFSRSRLLKLQIWESKVVMNERGRDVPPRGSAWSKLLEEIRICEYLMLNNNGIVTRVTSMNWQKVNNFIKNWII